jgi:hypothetical protein
MRTTTILASILTLAMALVACSKKGTDSTAPVASDAVTTGASAAPAEKPEAKAAAANEGAGQGAAAEAKCAAIGCESGDGSFFKMCGCNEKVQEAPFEAKATGKYGTFSKQPEWTVTNKTDKIVHWASAAVYYYDRAGKQLETTIKDKPYKASRVNGSSFTLKPKETKKVSIGFKQENAPAGTASMEVVFDGWCYGAYADKETHLCMRVARAPDERARSGK